MILLLMLKQSGSRINLRMTMTMMMRKKKKEEKVVEKKLLLRVEMQPLKKRNEILTFPSSRLQLILIKFKVNHNEYLNFTC